MRNQPKYHFFKNTIYALKGLKDIIKTESSFRIELTLFFISIPILIFIETTLTNKLLLFITLSLVLLTEAMNSAIERAVDLVTLEHQRMAGMAKDAGSAAVFISVVIALTTWGFILLDSFKLI
ncbi:diacylglycerol kinase [Halarcobacter ebronensis]|uniref:Diacylglycerol kinase n=1 Tax=Halarcobacter ebronensis TaxID=1462615 RepID=A0A4Q0YE62_9BACT|nr:diacylglycerol kinase [Halarcobacter ebronensis]QKF83135.1 diacylglycerol kinase [Halarcobacter ebronensis]RXJ67181.1 diacylglycerol kinase [Halarcobacter ebronensis]RXK05227.1 diacylglycerol kinase [Halarcobacter ebronensis]